MCVRVGNVEVRECTRVYLCLSIECVEECETLSEYECACRNAEQVSVYGCVTECMCTGVCVSSHAHMSFSHSRHTLTCM